MEKFKDLNIHFKDMLKPKKKLSTLYNTYLVPIFIFSISLYNSECLRTLPYATAKVHPGIALC